MSAVGFALWFCDIKWSLEVQLLSKNAWMGVSARRKSGSDRKIVLVRNSLAVAVHELNLGRKSEIAFKPQEE